MTLWLTVDQLREIPSTSGGRLVMTAAAIVLLGYAVQCLLDVMAALPGTRSRRLPKTPA